MSKRITIWNVYCDTDPAATDNYYPSEQEADEAAAVMESPHKRTIEITMTAEGICAALVWIPNR